MAFGLNTLGKVFGTEKALNGIVDGVSNSLDKLVYTDEEKQEAAAKDRAEARGMVVEWMRATQGQNLARRLIALLVTVVWLLMYLVTLLLATVAIWMNKDTAENLRSAAELVGERAYQMNGAMMLVLGFYFAAPHMGDIARSAIERFSDRRRSQGAQRKG